MREIPVETLGVAALLVTPRGGYLMQLRDDAAHVSMRGHWSLFGGVVEKGEDPASALLRELREELDFTPAHPPVFFSQLVFDLHFAGRGLHRKIFFEVPTSDDAIERMRLGEGQGMALFTREALLRELRVTPWDLYGVTLHARRSSITAALQIAPAR